MKHMPKRSVQFLVASAFAGFAFFLMYQPNIFLYLYLPVEVKPTDWTGARPAGEIVRDFKLVQPLQVRETEIDIGDHSDAICIKLLMANYANRRNRGSFAVRVVAPEVSQEKIVDASEVLDNEYERVCFEGIRFDQIYRKPAVLEIAGVDGEPGRSVTAWLSDTKEGDRAVVNNQATDLTLVHTVVLYKDAENYQYNAYGLMIFVSLLTGLLLTATRHPDSI
jgi:hypothetical protein